MASTEIGTVIGSDGEEIGSLAGVVSDNGVTAGALVLAGLILFIFLFYRYLRSFIYPCLTSFELDQALKDLDDVYPTSRNGVADAVAQEWNAIANDFLTLEIEASQIREKSFQGSPWKTYLGFHPQLMSDIVQCYSKYEELKSRILVRSLLH
ncbi:hypothetical protein L218DRAFT_964510 [Marasmius fiardii PR-910]|nr:hypothetical protein L218DRAFT_964510 [Marasmius fiardii PR-910]